MDKVKIHTQRSRQATWIPNYFIDDYMCDASGEYVKVYIYLLRCLSDHRMGLSIPMIADHLDITEKDVKRALKYWEQEKLIAQEYNSKNQLVGICLLDLDAQTADPQIAITRESESAAGISEPASSDSAAANADTSAFLHPQDDRPSYSPEQIANFKTDEEVAAMLFAVSSYMGHMLNSTEVNSILYWLDGLGFTPDLIEYLVEYCMSRDHNSIYYMDKVAMNWASKGITTVEDAQSSAVTHSKAYYAVCNAFGISGRNLNERELAYVSTWTGELGFTPDIITEACQRTIANIGKVSFEYANKILKEWHNCGVHTLADIAPLDSAHAAKAKQKDSTVQNQPKTKNRFHQFSSGDYDMDAIESALIHK